jgi:hypothetical protein
LLPLIASLVPRNPFRHPPQLRLSRQLVGFILNPKEAFSSLPPSKGLKGNFPSCNHRLLPAFHLALSLAVLVFRLPISSLLSPPEFVMHPV